MDKIIVEGGAVLNGEVSVSGAKNSALPILMSTLLAKGKHRFKNVPKLQDIISTKLLLENLGCEVSREGDDFIVDVKNEDNVEASYDLVRKMRASVLVLGPLLARRKKAIVSMPGGCAIGTRPIDQHLDGLKNLGVEVEMSGGNVSADASKLAGATVLFDGVTVGGTENLMMAATLAEGVTVLENAAKEPEIVDLANYLNKMGAKITGAGSSLIRIEGVEELRPAEHTVISDRIEAGTLLVAGAITGGEVTVRGFDPYHIEALTGKMRECGFTINADEDRVQVLPCNSWQARDVTTLPFPGFATDLQAQYMALMTQAQGSCIISENIFENRFMHVQELIRMGAKITPKTKVAVVHGEPGGLNGAPVMATDLRASACLILAGLAAKGETSVARIYHLDRGYENLEEKLASLGGKVKRVRG